MANWKKLASGAAGAAGAGGEPLYVEDVFSTYLYDGNGSTNEIPNGVQLGDGDTDAEAFTKAGTYQWTCPAGVSSVNVVCVGAGGVGAAGSGGGGGELRYKNNISVTAGNTYTVVVGAGGGTAGGYAGSSSFNGTTCVANGGQNGTSGSSTQAGGSGGTGDGGGNGGSGSPALHSYGSGGGAGGYSGAGGNGGNFNNHTAGSGGAGGGGASYINSSYLVAFAGGGVGIYGEGSSASKAGISNVNGGSGGDDGSSTASVSTGGRFGGGAGAANGSSLVSQRGGGGAVRIVWRANSSFPSTNVGFVSDGEGKGGMTWIKLRNSASNNEIYDSVRGVTKSLSPNTLNGEITRSTGLTSFNGNGFTVKGGTNVNAANYNVASWSWRLAPRFFDIQTYTGDGNSSRSISHDLEATPAFVLIKRTSADRDWIVHHRSMGFNQYGELNTGSNWQASTNHITAASSTTVTVGSNSDVNANGSTYVMYLFAHNNGDGGFGLNADQDIIKVDSYYGNGSTDGPEIDLGFEPQWVMIKNADRSSRQFAIFDNMRGVVTGGSEDVYLEAGLANAEANPSEQIEFNSTGFKLKTTGNARNGAGEQYVYVAIRRGPMAVPESAADVFDIATRDGTTYNGPDPDFSANHLVDFILMKDNTNTTGNWVSSSRLQQGKRLMPNTTDSEASSSFYAFDYMSGWGNSGNSADTNDYAWMWKRAPNFFDVVCYTGTGSTQTINHNLGVAPEMMLTKARTSTGQMNWYVNHYGINKYSQMTGSYSWQPDLTTYAPVTDSVFTPILNSNTITYVSYLFASLDGVSKVGSYTGNGTNQNIDCGFSNTARFVLVRGVSTATNWQIAGDFANGIVAGSDSLLRLDLNNAIVNFDFIDPYSGGFNVTGAQLNTNGTEYIFYAIA